MPLEQEAGSVRGKGSTPQTSFTLSTSAFQPLGGPIVGVPIFYSLCGMVLLQLPTLWMLSIALENDRISSERTWRTYAEHLLDWLRHLEQMRCDILNVSQAHLGAYKIHMLRNPTVFGTPTSGNTINGRLGVIRRFYAWMTSQGHIERYPFGTSYDMASGIGARKRSDRRYSVARNVRPPGRIPRRVPFDILRLVRKNLRDLNRERDLLIVDWAAATGMRLFEILALVITQLPDGATSSRFVSFTITKTKYRRARLIRVPIGLLDRTWRYINGERARIMRHTGKRERQAIFISESGAVVSQSAVRKHYRHALQTHRYRFHDLRHTFAVFRYEQLVEAKALNPKLPYDPISKLQVELGHLHLSSTQIYLTSLKLDSDDADATLTSILEEVEAA